MSNFLHYHDNNEVQDDVQGDDDDDDVDVDDGIRAATAPGNEDDDSNSCISLFLLFGQLHCC